MTKKRSSLGHENLIIWDHNGTTFNDVAAWSSAASAYYQILGYNGVNLDVMRDVYDTPIKTIVSNLDKLVASSVIGYEKPKADPHERALSAFYNILSEGIKSAKPRENIKEILGHLQDMGSLHAKFSNHDQPSLEKEVAQMGIRKFFFEVSGRETKNEILVKTTKEARVGQFIEDLQFPKHKIIYIGDAPEDARLAKSLGIKSIGLTGGYASKQRQYNAGHTAIVEDINNLPEVISALTI